MDDSNLNSLPVNPNQKEPLYDLGSAQSKQKPSKASKISRKLMEKKRSVQLSIFERRAKSLIKRHAKNLIEAQSVSTVLT